ncbi:MAG: response regulator [Anaerolineae bacterium]|nr:response regulator [Anaerolineae bacterium]
MKNGQQPRFLYVEDDMRSRMVVKMMLTKVMQYTDVTIFEDSANFMDRVKALPQVPDVIFLDVQIAPHDGYEMIAMLRSDPAYQDTIIIAMTANVMSHDVEKLQRVGFSGLIGKPILKENFPDLINKLLNGEAVWYIP